MPVETLFYKLFVPNLSTASVVLLLLLLLLIQIDCIFVICDIVCIFFLQFQDGGDQMACSFLNVGIILC